MSKSNENAPQLSVIYLGSLTADNNALPAMYFPKKSKVKSVHLITDTTIAADDSNFFSLELNNGSDNVAEMDSRAAHENGVTGLEGKALNVDDDNSEIAAGSTLKINYQETGTMALGNAQLVIEHFPY